MTSSTYKLEFVMPCLCAGADPKTAELRSSAVRGQLRWWFRALGGSFDEESRVFGRIGKKDEAIGSAVVIRTRILGKPPVWEPPEFRATDSEAYVWHFARVSGLSDADKDSGQYGPRWQEDGAIASGTKWELRVVIRRALDASLQSKFDSALRCFLALGSIGLRATRGLGSFYCAEVPFVEADLCPVLRNAGFALETQGVANGPEEAAKIIGSLVKGTRKAKGWKNDSQEGTETPSPMGSSTDPRQTSAIWFRPIRNATGKLSIVIFEAPHDRVLGERSRKPVSVGKSPTEIVAARVYDRRRR